MQAIASVRATAELVTTPWRGPGAEQTGCISQPPVGAAVDPDSNSGAGPANRSPGVHQLLEALPGVGVGAELEVVENRAGLSQRVLAADLQREQFRGMLPVVIPGVLGGVGLFGDLLRVE